jgi:8-oxo-dGTP pyrophosphatase MutT (NUDIX family)
MMDLKLFEQKDDFPLHVLEQLIRAPVDFREKHDSIIQSNSAGVRHREAGVAVLLYYKNSEYVFQLIKRSETVVQAGDISCPGGMLERSTDEMLGHILLKTNMVRAVDHRTLHDLPNQDKETASLVRLFLMNALREAWEEIGLSPLNVWFLGALPSYSLTLFSRTIFPVVCLVKEPYDFQLSDEVEKVLEIPLRFFFQSSFYAMVEIVSGPGDSDSPYWQAPCLVIPDGNGSEDILWGATFNIITIFLRIVAGDAFSIPSPLRTVQKVLVPHYTGKAR